jgi:serine/threonine protein kinase
MAESGDSLQSPASGFFGAAELAPGDAVAHYRIQEKLGEGGMGVVYKASDSRLGRSVALKFVKTEFTSRSQREARAVASLNHPNICTLHDVGPNYLVMELVEGPTLAERIAKGPIPIPEALDIAHQIAEALEAAHEKGIVHRDLKPANVKLTADGKVKVLDFGLAKALLPIAEDSPTLTVSEMGTILGTPAYMSPEQAGGKPVDKRADIWSFGVVLWEMLTGKRLFAGDTITQTLADVLRGPIDFENLPRATPAAIKSLLRRCLDRNEKSRLRDIGEARVAIDAQETDESAPGHRSPWLAWSVATAALAALVLIYAREKPSPPAATLRFQVAKGPNANYAVLSPDGRKLAIADSGRLWVHSLESGERRDLTAADGGTPFWSPDSRQIGYPFQGKLKRIEASGGPPQTITDRFGSWGAGAWNQDDVIVFGDLWVGLFRVPAAGGVPVQITALDPERQEDRHWGPSFLPDGTHFVYIRASDDWKKSGIYLGSLNAKPEMQSSTRLVASRWQPGYTPSTDSNSGYLLFIREATLMAQPFDNQRMEVKGVAMPIAEGVSLSGGGGAGGWADYSASSRDSVAFLPRALDQLTWYDREGKALGVAGEPAVFWGAPAISPDGSRVAVSERTGEDANIWALDLSRDGTSNRLTFGSVFDTYPAWSPDSRGIAFVSEREGPEYLYKKWFVREICGWNWGQVWR